MGAPSDSIRTHLFTCSQSQGLLKNTFPYLELEVAPWDKWYMHNPLFQSSQVTSIPPFHLRAKKFFTYQRSINTRKVLKPPWCRHIGKSISQGRIQSYPQESDASESSNQLFLRVCLIIMSQSNSLQVYPLRQLTLVYLMQSLMILVVHLCGR